VDEGGLPGWADVVLPAPTPEELLRASMAPERRDVAIPSVEDIARQVMGFYASLEAGDSR
jgi:hypothetical protein